jgi:hypothetical protein
MHSGTNPSEKGKPWQAMYVQSNNEAGSCKYCCCGKSKSVTYCECVFVASVMQHAMRLPHSTIFSPHYLIKGRILGRKQNVTEQKMCALIFSKNFV